MADADAGGFPSLTVADREFVVLRLAAMLAGSGLVAAYFLPWIDIVGHAWPATADGQTISVGSFTEGVEQGTIAASEISVFPELVALMGVVTVVASLLWWNRWVHLVVVASGITGTGIGLVMRESLNDRNVIIRVGGYEGLAGAFEPAIGLWLALVCSVLLIGIGFGGFLNTLEEKESSDGTEASDDAEGSDAPDDGEESDAPDDSEASAEPEASAAGDDSG